jgi:hypothetical protein
MDEDRVWLSGDPHVTGTASKAEAVNKRSMVRVIRNGLQTDLLWDAPAADCSPGTQWVPGGADAPADCTHEKSLQIQAFSRAADGIRTHDLLHGKQSMQRRIL